MVKGMIELTEDEMVQIVTMMKLKIYRLEEENKEHKRRLDTGNHSQSFNGSLKKWISENESEMKRLDNFGDEIISRFNRGRIEDGN